MFVSGGSQTAPPIFCSFAHPEFPPLPFNPFPDLTLYWLGEGLFLYDDRDVDYVRLRAEAQEASSTGLEKDVAILSREVAALISGSQTEGEGALTIAKRADGLLLTASGMQSNTQYALLSKKDLWQQNWEAESVFTSSSSGQWSKGPFTPSFPQKFYKLQRPTLPIVWVECYCDTLIGCGFDGRFVVRRRNCDTSNALAVHWTVSGTATPKSDYIPFGNSVTIGVGSDSAEVYVQAYDDAEIVPPPYETVIVTLEPDPSYWIDARYNAATNKICRELFVQVVERPQGSIGIDYYPVQGDEGLLISDNFWSSGNPCNFTRIFRANGQVLANQWSSVTGLPDEIKVVTAKSSVANFQQGDMFFGYKPSNGDTRIGRICAGGSTADLAWAVLSGETSPVHGGLHIDQTGLFDHDLIVVTGGDPGQGGSVWRIKSNPDHSSGTKTLFKTIFGAHLEGVITVPNEPTKYGPWAGKIITGDESHKDKFDQNDPVIYSIDDQGLVEEFHLGVAPEDFDIIQEDQALYCNDPSWRVIRKVPSWYFAEHVGDILVTQAGEVTGDGILEVGYALLLILHWDAEQNRFFQKVIFPPQSAMFEHVTFAPIDL